MRRIASIMTIAVLALTAACGSDGESGSDGASARDRTGGTAVAGDAGLDVCGLVSDTTVEKLQATAVDPQPAPSEVLMTDAELFVQCLVLAGPDVGVAVRAAPGGPELESLVEGSYGGQPEALEGVGDRAVIGTNSYDGVRIAARVGDQELLVDSEAYVSDDGDGIGRDDVVALAKEAAAQLGDERPGAIRLPKACPATDTAEVRTAVGETVVARGSAASNGSVSCSYVSQERKARLGAVVGNRGMGLMALADSPEENRLEVDGDPALYDDRDGITVFVGKDCVLGAAASPVGWGLADQRPEAEQRAEAIELVTYVKETIGCP